MLVVTRKVGESILLPDLNIKIMITSIERNQVQVGIEAPKEILILREELNRKPPAKFSGEGE